MMHKLLTCQVMFTAAMFAQGPLQFEVATIKPAPALVAGVRASVGVHIDRNQFQASSMALRDYIAIAHGLPISRIEAPEWMTTERFDVHATMPTLSHTVDEKELGQMMLGLLKERFSLKAHLIQKELPVYALVQMKNGIQAKESPLEAETGSVTVGGSGGNQGTVIDFGRGSTLTIGGNHITATKFSMLTLAETLSRFVDRPVQDFTGLTSTYDVDMALTQEDFQASLVRSAVSNGVALPPQALKILEVASGDSIHEALARLGLKLEARKVPLDVLIVDAANHEPTEN